MTGGKPQLTFESHAGSAWQIHGAGIPAKETTIGFYVDPPAALPGPMPLSNLPLGVIGSEAMPFSLTLPGNNTPQLSLYNVNLGPLGWQIYVGNGGAPGVAAIIQDSVVNEVGVFTNGHIEFVNSVAQLAVLAAVGQNASLHVAGSNVWSQRILAGPGGVVQIEASRLNGTVLEADAGGALQVADPVTQFWADGNSTTCDGNSILSYLSSHGGVPNCNPFSNLGKLSQRVNAAGNIVITGAHPACFANNGSYASGFVFDAGPSTTISAGGSVQCIGDQTKSTTFSAYPVELPGFNPGASETCVVTTNGGSDRYTLVAPSCS